MIVARSEKGSLVLVRCRSIKWVLSLKVSELPIRIKHHLLQSLIRLVTSIWEHPIPLAKAVGWNVWIPKICNTITCFLRGVILICTHSLYLEFLFTKSRTALSWWNVNILFLYFESYHESFSLYFGIISCFSLKRLLDW